MEGQRGKKSSPTLVFSRARLSKPASLLTRRRASLNFSPGGWVGVWGGSLVGRGGEPLFWLGFVLWMSAV